MNADIVIIGAGPAGSTVARITASEGLKVIVLEKEKEIGKSPCAGYVSCIDFPDIDRKVIQTKINRMRTYLPSGRYQDFLINGFNVNRNLFDRELALNAVRCGAEFHINSEVTNLIEKEGEYSGVRTKDGREIRAKVIVGADGASSTISRLLGFKNDVATAVQYEVSNCKVDPEINEIYFDVEYAPGCYAWIFPTSGDSARVGLAVRSYLVDREILSERQNFVPRDKVNTLSSGKRVIKYLDSFINEHPIASKKFRKSLKTKLIAGIIPVGGLHKRICKDNIFLVGDSAGMTDPITGAGISYAITAGRIAARAVVKAIKEDDISILKEYEKGFGRIMGRHYEMALKKRKLMDSLTDNKSLERNLPKVWVTFEEYWS